MMLVIDLFFDKMINQINVMFQGDNTIFGRVLPTEFEDKKLLIYHAYVVLHQKAKMCNRRGKKIADFLYN